MLLLSLITTNLFQEEGIRTIFLDKIFHSDNFGGEIYIYILAIAYVKLQCTFFDQNMLISTENVQCFKFKLAFRGYVCVLLIIFKTLSIFKLNALTNLFLKCTLFIRTRTFLRKARMLLNLIRNFPISPYFRYEPKRCFSGSKLPL